MLAFLVCDHVAMITTPAASRDRLFYGAMAIAMGLTVFGGFARTYYGPLTLGGPRATLSGGPWTFVVHTHAALFTSWVLLFIVQTALVAGRRVAIHRRLGIAGAVLAAGMVVAGAFTAIRSAARGGAPPGIDPLSFMAVPIFDLVMFSSFIGTALVWRRDKETHKRLMLLAYVSIIAAATARLPGVQAFGPPAFFGLALTFVVAGVIYDLVSRGRVHPVYKWGGTMLLLSVPLRLLISNTAPWRSFAEWLVR